MRKTKSKYPIIAERIELPKGKVLKYKKLPLGTCYRDDTPDSMAELLEGLRVGRGRYKFWYGDVKTGRAWGDVEAGRIGRSTGSIKIPLVIKTARSMGGGALLSSCIVKITESRGGREVYKHPHYKDK